MLCSGSGPPLQDYDPADSAYGFDFSTDTQLFIFPSMPIHCDGEIVKWRYYARTTGTMVAAIWEAQAGSGIYKLIGKNIMFLKKKGSV